MGEQSVGNPVSGGISHNWTTAVENTKVPQ